MQDHRADYDSLTVTEKFEQFYRDYCHEDIGKLAQEYDDKRSLFIEYDDLYRFDRDLVDDWMNHPDKMREYAEEALRVYDLPVDVGFENAHVRLTDNRDAAESVTVPSITSKDIGDYVAVRGKLSRVTEVNHRLDNAAFECQRCGSLNYIPQPRMSTDEPHDCQGCEREGPFKINTAKSEWLDQRKLKVEELPGERPDSNAESVTVFVDDDLCHHGGPNGLPDRNGQDVVVLGQYNVNEDELTGRNANNEAGGWIEAHAIAFLSQDHEDVDVEAHKDEFVELANDPDCIEKQKQSLVPGMHADEDLDRIFEASVAWLFNAYRVEPDEGSGTFRGDLHMGIIGAPGRGKSTLGSALDEIAPKSEFRSGTGLSKVGLTAATVQEEFAGQTEWSLSPGILPRSNGGHCIIDEVDDVIDENTKALHDALEGEQMVKVDKADISANLPTRTALLAMGNPRDGTFDRFEPLKDQIDLDDALVDRLDLLFTLDADLDLETHREVADHVVDSFDELSQQQAYENGADVEPTEPDTTEREVSADTLRAMVVYARENVFPTLTDQTKQMLKEFYVSVQDLNDNEEDPTPATPRRLEAGIRLSVAFARAELSETVEPRHAERAISLSKHVIGHNYDPESGKFDSARTGKGTPKSQKERMNGVLEVIREMQEVDNNPHIDEIVEECESELGLSANLVEDTVVKLAEKGELYQPKRGNGEYRAS